MRAGRAGQYGLEESFSALDQVFEARFVGIARLAGVDDRDLAVFRRFDELGVGAGVDVDDGGLLVTVVDLAPRAGPLGHLLGASSGVLQVCMPPTTAGCGFQTVAK